MEIIKPTREEKQLIASVKAKMYKKTKYKKVTNKIIIKHCLEQYIKNG